MSRRTLLLVGLALVLIALAKVLSMSREPRSASALEAAAPDGASPSATAPPAPAPVTLAMLPVAVTELGVLTDRPESDLEAIADRGAIADALTPALCGDEAACAAVRDLLRDDKATQIDVRPSGDWRLEQVHLDASARGFTSREQAKIRAMPRLVDVRVSAPRSPNQVALRAAIAATALVAEKIEGLVWDQLLDRFEKAKDFAAHAVTEPLGAPTVRRDRVEMLTVPKAEGVERILTAGLSRWGAPDVEAAAVPEAAQERVAEIVLGVGAALGDGASSSPVTLSLDDLGRLRGRAYPGDAGLPDAGPIAVTVEPVHPETGDPNDRIVRILPQGGEGPLAYVELAERFFGPLIMGSPGEDVLDARRRRAQSALAPALARWSREPRGQARLLVQLPFGIPGDGGTESMWVEVTSYDDRTVTGTLKDDPLGATEVHEGEEVTRPRTDVEDLALREDGGT